jgi:hypothetical protein
MIFTFLIHRMSCNLTALQLWLCNVQQKASVMEISHHNLMKLINMLAQQTQM